MACWALEKEIGVCAGAGPGLVPKDTNGGGPHSLPGLSFIYGISDASSTSVSLFAA